MSGLPGLPPPATFAEGQRLIYGWLVALAGMFCGAAAVALVAILVWGHWPATLYGQILTILGLTLGGFIAAMTAVIVGLMIGGPVGRFKGSVTKEGATFEAENDAAAIAGAKVTTTVETPPPTVPLP